MPDAVDKDQRIADLESFVSNVAHDLKGPLTVISGSAQTLRAAWDRLSEGDRVKLLDAISSQASRAAQMIDDLRPGPSDGDA